MRAMIILLLLVLTACSNTTPYLAARHVSDPGLEADGWDLACAGIKKRGRWQIKGGYCWNARGGDMAEASIEWEVFD